jgi:iron transport multicopper oxidase
MAPSLSKFLAPLALLSSIANCATVTYDFDIAWTYANPDGQQTRPVMGVNGKWPVPAIVATKGDQVIVNVKNSLGNESTSLHFHGLYQNGTTHMDGPVQVSQCGIMPGSSFTYNFTVRMLHVESLCRSNVEIRVPQLVLRIPLRLKRLSC